MSDPGIARLGVEVTKLFAMSPHEPHDRAAPRPWPAADVVGDPAASALASLAACASARCLAPADDGDADMVARVARHAACLALVRALRRRPDAYAPGSLPFELRWHARARERHLERLPARLAAGLPPPAPLAGFPIDLPRAARLRAAYGAARVLAYALVNAALDGRRALLLGEAPPAGEGPDGRPRRAWTGPGARRIERLASVRAGFHEGALALDVPAGGLAMSLRTWCAPDNVAREACDLGALPIDVVRALAAAALAPENVRGRAVVLVGRLVSGLGFSGAEVPAEGRWIEVADTNGRSTAWCRIDDPMNFDDVFSEINSAAIIAGVLRPLAEAALIGSTWRPAGPSRCLGDLGPEPSEESTTSLLSAS